MAVADIRPILEMVPTVRDSPEQSVWMTYDQGADTLYVQFKKPNLATDSELTDSETLHLITKTTS